MVVFANYGVSDFYLYHPEVVDIIMGLGLTIRSAVYGLNFTSGTVILNKPTL